MRYYDTVPVFVNTFYTVFYTAWMLCYDILFIIHVYHFIQVTFASKSIDATLNLLKPGECVVSYLPLSHIAGLCVDLFSPIYTGGTVYFAQPDALKVS